MDRGAWDKFQDSGMGLGMALFVLNQLPGSFGWNRIFLRGFWAGAGAFHGALLLQQRKVVTGVRICEVADCVGDTCAAGRQTSGARHTFPGTTGGEGGIRTPGRALDPTTV